MSQREKEERVERDADFWQAVMSCAYTCATDCYILGRNKLRGVP